MASVGRRFAQALRSFGSHSSSSHNGRTPTVYERVISFMCVTEKGERTIVRAFEGDSLSAALQQANLLNLTNSYKDEMLPGEVDVHVILSKEWHAALPSPDALEKRTLGRLVNRGDVRETSRIASHITLDKSSNGMYLAIGAMQPNIYLHS